MALYDNIDLEIEKELKKTQQLQQNITNNSNGIFDDIDSEVEELSRPKTFAENHPIIQGGINNTKELGQDLVHNTQDFVTNTVAPKTTEFVHSVGDNLTGAVSQIGQSTQSIKPYEVPTIEPQVNNVVSEPIQPNVTAVDLFNKGADMLHNPNAYKWGKPSLDNLQNIQPEYNNGNGFDTLSNFGADYQTTPNQVEPTFHLSATKNVLTDNAIQQLKGSEKKEFAKRAITEVVKQKLTPQEQVDNAYRNYAENRIKADAFDSKDKMFSNYYLDNGLNFVGNNPIESDLEDLKIFTPDEYQDGVLVQKYKELKAKHEQLTNGKVRPEFVVATKQAIKRYAKASVDLNRSIFSFGANLSALMNNEEFSSKLLNIANKWEHLSNQIVPDENKNGVSSFTKYPMQTVVNLFAESAPLMGSAMGTGIAVTGGLSAIGVPLPISALVGAIAGFSVNNMGMNNYSNYANEYVKSFGQAPNKKVAEEAIVESITNSILETASDYFAITKFIPRGARGGVVQVLKKFVEQALTEGTTEALQERRSISTEKNLGLNNATDDENFKRELESFGGGALLGGVFGGVAGATQSIQNKSRKQKYDVSGIGLSTKAELVNDRQYAVNTYNVADYDTKGIGLSTEVKPTQTRYVNSDELSEFILNARKNGARDVKLADGNLGLIDDNGNVTYFSHETTGETKNIRDLVPFDFEENNNVISQLKIQKNLKQWKSKTQQPPEVIYQGASDRPLLIDKNVKKSPLKKKIEKLAPDVAKKKELQEQIDNAKISAKNNIFIPEMQKDVLIENLRGEEKEYFANKIEEVSKVIENAPEIHQTQTIPTNDIKPVMHYFGGTFDAYIFEIDKKTGDMFGAISMGHEYELGYINMNDINSIKPRFVGNALIPSIEMDLYYDNNQTFGDIIGANKPIETDIEKVVQDEQQATNKQSRIAERENEESEVIRRGNDDSRRSNINGLESERGQRGQRGRITEQHKEVVEQKFKNQHELNTAIENFINNKEYEVYDGNLPDEIKGWLKKYAGAGGLEKQGAEGKGLLSEYYTPENIVKKMWDMVAQYIETDGAKVLEPSVGIGRFLEFAPSNTNFDVVEMNPVSAKITELLYPDANVSVGQFQERFIEKNRPVKNVTPEYDIVIGNPPYGQYSGLYKGMGEGKGYERIESYFINRSLDSVKENGIVAFIVPSSFIDSSKGKLEIKNKCKLLDAYRLPENTFDTTSIGTDIIILRKDTGSATDSNLNSGVWFKKHPEKILGNVETRKDRFGKLEKYVKGNKNAVDNIDTSFKDIQETETVIEVHKPIKKSTKTNSVTKKNSVTQKTESNEPVEYDEYIPEITISKEDYKYFEDTKIDGTLPSDKYSPNEKVNQYNGKLYNDFNYLQGDIYEKLDALKYENISDEQKAIQRKKLEEVLPKPKTSENINYEVTSDFIRHFKADLGEKNEYIYGAGYVKTPKTLADVYLDYVRGLSKIERGEVSVWDIQKFVNGDRLSFKRDIRVPHNIVGEQEIKKYKEVENRRLLSVLQNTVNKTFNNFVKDILSDDVRKALEEKYNRTFNNIYTPDYAKMPMIVKGLNSQFYGNKLNLQNVQVEGVNFLTNKGAGLLGFEVGLGKTLTGIISTVQNMQMGRCKKPLILVPKQVKDNWIAEIKEAFPNIKVNDVDNLSKFKGEIEDNSLTVATYEALSNMWYEKGTELDLITDIYNASIKEKPDATSREREKTKEQAESVLGKALGGNKQLHTIQELGFDHITVDEAHNFKNLFEKAQSFNDEGNHYAGIQGGTQSTRACRLFLLSQHIMRNNNNRNVFLLTATPFNNNALEVFNMLSYTAKDILDKKGLSNIYQFMEHFAETTSEWVVDSNNNVVYKQIVKGFKNAGALKDIINSTMLIRSAEDAGIIRPNKMIKRVYLDPTPEQQHQIAMAEELALNNKDDGDVLRAINQSRSATLSPDIATDNIDVSPEDFVKNAPKIDFCLKAIGSMAKGHPNTSQILYMPLGVKFLPKIKQYLVNKKVFKNDEVVIFDSKVDDDKIMDIVESFNDKNGKIKLIIGTKKIREGMNLNKNSSVLYVPYLDWNPTDFQQIVGRIWRRGNRYKDIRIVVPTLNNSSDSFLFQKNQEKMDRINSLLSKETGDYIDLGELNTIEDKINMITDPHKKAKMFIQFEAQKIDSEIASLNGRIESSQDFKQKLEEGQKYIEYLEKDSDIEYYTDLMNKTEKGTEDYERYQLYLKDKKDKIKKAKNDLESIKKRIKRLELDLDGADSVENLKLQLAEKTKLKENLKEVQEKKLQEYKIQYKKDQRNKKTIDELVKEFENESEQLYKGKVDEDGYLYSVDIPEFLRNDNVKTVDTGVDIDLDNIYIEISKGIKGRDLMKLLPSEIAEIFETNARFRSYTFKNFEPNNKNVTGGHLNFGREIRLNLNAISNSPYKFVETLLHELRHAQQEYKYLEIIKKPKNSRTKEENIFVENYKKCKEVNKKKQRYYNKHKKLIDKFAENKFYSAEERANAISQLSQKEQDIIDTYYKLFNNYFDVQFEVEAREQGALYARKYKQQSAYDIPRATKILSNSTIRNRKWNLGTGTRSSSEQLFSYEESNYKPRNSKVDESQLPSNDVLEERAKEHIYTWYGGLYKDRYNLNRSLQSFVNLSKSKARTFNNAHKGLKVTDKQIREIMPFLRERTEIPENLNRDDLIKLWNTLSKQEKADLTKFADEVSEKFEKYYKNYKLAKGTIDENTIENHISHIWKFDNKQKSLLTNYFTTNSRFAKQRTIETLIKGIDGFEVNGEKVYLTPKTLDYAEILKISNDNLIKATHDSLLAEKVKGLKFNKQSVILPVTKAPADWVEISHPALNKAVYLGSVGENELPLLMKTPVKVHPAIADTLKTVFETQKADNMGWVVYDSMNGLVKQTQLGFSGFHGCALTESAIGNLGLSKTMKVLNPKKIYNAIANGDYDIYKQDAVAKKAIEDGLQLGTPLDMERGRVEELFNKVPVLGKFLGGTVSLNNKILWDYLHNSYKLECYKLMCSQASENGSLTLSERREICHWINDSFGGQAWELLGLSAKSRKAESRILLSPDWFRSTTRQFFGMFSNKKLDDLLTDKANNSVFWEKIKKQCDRWGVASNTSNSKATHLRGKLARAFWLRTILYSVVFYNVLNIAFRLKDEKEHPEYYQDMSPLDYTIWGNSLPADSLSHKILPYIFIGRNNDGAARYLRLGKQFREVPELISEPVTKLSGKTAPVISLSSQLFTGKNPSDLIKSAVQGSNDDVFLNQNLFNGYGKWAKKKEGGDLVKGMAKTLGKGVLPFYASNMLDEKHDNSAWDFIAQTSKGTTKYKATKQYNEVQKRGNNPKDIAKIDKKAYMDGMSYLDVLKSKKSANKQYKEHLKNKYQEQFVNALEKQDQKAINRVVDKMTKDKVPAINQSEVYMKAYKEYLKELHK